MSWKKVLCFIGLFLPIVVLCCLNVMPINGLFHLGEQNRIITVGLLIMTCLLMLYSVAYSTVLEIIGTLVYAMSAVVVVVSNNFIMMLSAWEIGALASMIILSSACKNSGPIIRYACMHFIGGSLILAAISSNVFHSIDIESFSSTSKIVLAIGILINCAAFPVFTWVIESYPAASPHGSAVLQLFATKSALFILFTLFQGCNALIPIGLVTAIYSLIYSTWQNNFRMIFAYNTVGQMGLLISSVGFGANIMPYLFSSIMYQTTMYMVSGVVIYATGKEKLTDLGGLFKQMPIFALCGIIALLAMASMPLTVSFNYKALMMESINSSVLLVLFLMIHTGLMISCGMRMIYFTFFHHNTYPKVIVKSRLSTITATVLSTLLCVIPIFSVKSAYDVMYVSEQLSLFILAFVVFYLVRLPWYRISFTMPGVDYIYRVLLVKLLLVIEASCMVGVNRVIAWWKQSVCQLFNKFDNIQVDSISYTIVLAMILIGILLRIYA